MKQAKSELDIEELAKKENVPVEEILSKALSLFCLSRDLARDGYQIEARRNKSIFYREVIQLKI